MCKRYLPVTRKSSVGSSQVRETCRISLNTSMLFIGGEVTFRTDLANRMRAHTVLRIQAVYVYTDARKEHEENVLGCLRGFYRGTTAAPRNLVPFATRDKRGGLVFRGQCLTSPSGDRQALWKGKGGSHVPRH